jgi:uncharacterized protein with FMN-binding domain
MRRVILAIVSTAAVLAFLLSFKTHSTLAVPVPPVDPGSAPSGSGSATGSSASTRGPTSPHGSAAPRTSTTPHSSGRSASRPVITVAGAASDTMYGPVQVQLTVKNGKVTAAEAIEYPNQSQHDVEINSYAIPVLNQEAVAAGSARIDTVSGATYTSNGYISSLQSALDKAGL